MHRDKDWSHKKGMIHMNEVYLIVGFIAFWLTVIVLIAASGYQLRKSVVRAGGWAPFWEDFFGIEESK